LLFQIHNLCRYDLGCHLRCVVARASAHAAPGGDGSKDGGVGIAGVVPGGGEQVRIVTSEVGGLYKSNPVDRPQREKAPSVVSTLEPMKWSPGFDKVWVFKWVNLCRYSESIAVHAPYYYANRRGRDSGSVGGVGAAGGDSAADAGDGGGAGGGGGGGGDTDTESDTDEAGTPHKSKGLGLTDLELEMTESTDLQRQQQQHLRLPPPPPPAAAPLGPGAIGEKGHERTSMSTKLRRREIVLPAPTAGPDPKFETLYMQGKQYEAEGHAAAAAAAGADRVSAEKAANRSQSNFQLAHRCYLQAADSGHLVGGCTAADSP
jgi:hypothetical protein